MLDNILFTEVVAAARRADLERSIERARLEDLVNAERAEHDGVRAALASAIVRVGMFVDANAGRRAAAPQH